jgi:hypothetical protein
LSPISLKKGIAKKRREKKAKERKEKNYEWREN